MAKRRADKELNHDNWQEEESDDVDYNAPFQRASEEELAKRKIRTAKRRGPLPSSEPPSTGVFKSFTGFGNLGSSGSFNFTPSEQKSKFEVTSFKVPTSSVSAPSEKDATSTPTFSFKQKSPTVSVSKEDGKPDTSETNNKLYLSNLKALNEGVLKWIQKHLDKNINVNLMPVFDDYKKHFEELENKYKPKFSKKVSAPPPVSVSNGSSSPPKEASKATSSPVKPQVSPFTLEGAKGSLAKDSKSPQPDTAPTSVLNKPFPPPGGTSFSFGKSSGFSFGGGDNKTPAEKPPAAFSFGGGGGSLTFGAKEGFSFATSTASSFSFGSAAPATSAPAATEDDYTPPQAEVLEVKEDDAVYEKKCKLFYKNDNSYVEKGKGTLFLKPVADSKKTQLVVRAATSLGNVLLNIILSTNMPTKRTGKNNVLIVCVPNPPIDPKSDGSIPMPMLIRVKTEEDADELLQKLDEYKAKE